MSENYIGTSGWAYSEWRGRFYPPGLRPGGRLAYMATQLNTVELNSSFYRLPAPAMLARWAEAVPPGFRFAVKVWNEITHKRRLIECEDAIAAFMDSVAPLRDRAGPLLLQLPPSLATGAAPQLDRVLALLASRGAAQIAVEFRHASWEAPDNITATHKLLNSHGAALVMHDMKRKLTLGPNDAPFAYIRLHGVKSDYKGPYGADFLRSLATAIRGWENNETYVFFNNTMTGDAPLEALALSNLLSKLLEDQTMSLPPFSVS